MNFFFPSPTRHIVLLGDSTFDNKGYTQGGPSVVEHLAKLVPKATLLAKDGGLIHAVNSQSENIPEDATHVVVSIGGNNGLEATSVLLRECQTVEEGVILLGERMADLEIEYRDVMTKLVEKCKGKHKVVLCSVYKPCFEHYDVRPRQQGSDPFLSFPFLFPSLTIIIQKLWTLEWYFFQILFTESLVSWEFLSLTCGQSWIQWSASQIQSSPLPWEEERLLKESSMWLKNTTLRKSCVLFILKKSERTPLATKVNLILGLAIIQNFFFFQDPINKCHVIIFFFLGTTITSNKREVRDYG